jgi:hypothetical protein
MEKTRPDNETGVSIKGSAIRTLVDTKAFSYTFLIMLLLFISLCGYFLVYSGSLFIEAITNQWYSAEAAEMDQESFLLGYLFGFPSLLGVIGGIWAMASQPNTWFRFKVLMFVPSTLWAVLLVLDILRRPMYLYQLAYHIPAMALCLFVLLGVIWRARVPYLDRPGGMTRSAPH